MFGATCDRLARVTAYYDQTRTSSPPP